MSDFTTIQPRDDSVSIISGRWCEELSDQLRAKRHTRTLDIDDSTPADRSTIEAGIPKGGRLVCYFGHGDQDSWSTGGVPTIDGANVIAASGKAVVSVACKTGKHLGPDAITAGAESWLGFTISVPVFTHGGTDPIGDALINALQVLGDGDSMQDAKDKLFSELDALIGDFDDGGSLSSLPIATLGYFAAMSLRDHINLIGNHHDCPLP
jgi:hypothetical protein